MHQGLKALQSCFPGECEQNATAMWRSALEKGSWTHVDATRDMTIYHSLLRRMCETSTYFTLVNLLVESFANHHEPWRTRQSCTYFVKRLQQLHIHEVKFPVPGPFAGRRSWARVTRGSVQCDGAPLPWLAATPRRPAPRGPRGFLLGHRAGPQLRRGVQQAGHRATAPGPRP